MIGTASGYAFLLWFEVKGWIKVSRDPCRGSAWLGALFKNSSVSNGAYGYLATSVITSLTCVFGSLRRWTIPSPILVGSRMDQDKNKNNNNNKDAGSAVNRPVGATSSEKRAEFKTSSNAATTMTGAKLGQSRVGQVKRIGNPQPKWPIFKITDPSKAGYQDRRNAARLLSRVHTTPPTEAELTKELKMSIDWAKSVLPNFQLDRPETPAAAAKRQRSAEGEKPLAKKVRTHGVTPHKSFAEVAKNRIVIGVLDEGDPEGKIPKQQWKWVQAALAQVAMEVLLSNPGPPPSCTDAGWHQGQIKLIACDDERSVRLYKIAISKVGEVYPGAKLVAVDKKDIPSRPRAKVWVPSTPSDPGQIMQLFRACNPNLPTDKWKYVKTFDNNAVSDAEPKRATKLILLLISDDSLEPLAKSDGEVNYGFGKVKVRTYRADMTDNLASEDEDVDNNEDDMDESDGESSGHISSGSDATAGLIKLLSQKELLGEDDANATITNAPPTDKPSP